MVTPQEHIMQRQLDTLKARLFGLELEMARFGRDTRAQAEEVRRQIAMVRQDIAAARRRRKDNAETG